MWKESELSPIHQQWAVPVPGTQLPATASETDSTFSQHSKVGAELNGLPLPPFNRLETPYLRKQKNHVDLYSKERKSCVIVSPIQFPSETLKLTVRKNIIGSYLENLFPSDHEQKDAFRYWIHWGTTDSKKNSAANEWM